MNSTGRQEFIFEFKITSGTGIGNQGRCKTEFFAALTVVSIHIWLIAPQITRSVTFSSFSREEAQSGKSCSGNVSQ